VVVLLLTISVPFFYLNKLKPPPRVAFIYHD